jgi:quercetin dioxygenase-like cupin family protein
MKSILATFTVIAIAMPAHEIRPGDSVWIPPGIKHWHGATATVGMSHIAFSEALDGKTVEWME